MVSSLNSCATEHRNSDPRDQASCSRETFNTTSPSVLGSAAVLGALEGGITAPVPALPPRVL